MPKGFKFAMQLSSPPGRFKDLMSLRDCLILFSSTFYYDFSLSSLLHALEVFSPSLEFLEASRLTCAHHLNLSLILIDEAGLR